MSRFNIYIRETASNQAYWISRSGELIDVGKTHIDAVIKNPKKFGYTDEKIKDIYDKYNEKIGQEGKAREEIIVDLIGHGWVRVRRYRNEGYSVNISRMTKKMKDRLFSWADKLLNKGINGVKEDDKYIPVNIQGFQDRFNGHFTLQDIANDALYEGTEVFDKENAIIILESAEDLRESINIDRNTNFKSALLKPITDLFDKMNGEEDDKKWTRLNNKAKKEFKRLNVDTMDFHGLHDLYISTKK